uniref:Proteasome endopeptidase complex n=1 Tax=Odontella aurita TaxID=265563 RepID=A0A7S4JRZ3_9STRA|mmetsp:Transcript_52858/g.158216  ORF Transcript_52858/g.158216 Transcript_52858/m.158216 type:complete len:346 (+) Transcript_52858:143-1180(+)
MKATTFSPLALILLATPKIAEASAAGQDTLVGVVGRDFVVLGADSSVSSSIAVTSSNLDKISVIVDPFPDEHFGGGTRRDDDDDDRRQRAVAVAAAGDIADADRLVSVLAAHAAIREYEAGVGCDVECVFDGRLRSEGFAGGAVDSLSAAGLDAASVAHLARGEIATSLRSRGGHLKVCLLVAGMVRCQDGKDSEKNLDSDVFSSRIRKQIEMAAGGVAFVRPRVEKRGGGEDEGEKYMDAEDKKESLKVDVDRGAQCLSSNLIPRLFWLDEYGSLQSLSYGAHGFGANFALSILDRGFRMNLKREEAIALVKDCFEQLRTRYVINSPQPPCIKCIDAKGCQLIC